MNRKEWFFENRCSVKDLSVDIRYDRAQDLLEEMQKNYAILSEKLGKALANACMVVESSDNNFCITAFGEVAVPKYLLMAREKHLSWQLFVESVLRKLKHTIEAQEEYAKAALEEMVG